jgi:hypothetical protein
VCVDDFLSVEISIDSVATAETSSLERGVIFDSLPVLIGGVAVSTHH